MALQSNGDPGPRVLKWIVMMSSFGLQLIVSGASYSAGVFYVLFNEEIAGNSILVSLACSLNLGITFGIGPFAGAVNDLLGCRITALLGTCIGTVGFLLTMFVSSSWQLCLTFGILIGIGNGLMYNPSVKVVSQYFMANLPFAMNVACAGSGVGPIVFPPVIQYNLPLYGYKGTLLLITGLYLQGLVFGCLLKPVKKRISTEKNRFEAKQKIEEKTNDKKGTSRENNEKESLAKEKEEIQTKTSKFAAALKIHLLKNVLFDLQLLNGTLYAFGSGVVMVYTEALTIQKGFSAQQGAMLYFIYGISQTISPFLYGLITQSPKVSVLPVYMVTALAGAVCTMVYPILGTYWEMALLIALIGGFFSPFNCLAPLVTMQLVGEENLAVGYGYTGTACLPGYLLAGPTAGWLYNIDHQYLSAYLGGGIVIVASVILLFPIQFQCFAKSRNEYDEME